MESDPARHSIKFEWDTQKNIANERTHGLSLEAAMDFAWYSALILEDTRHDYGERRYNAYGYNSVGRPMVVCFTPRGRNIRLISYRPMNFRERKKFCLLKKE